MLLIVVIAIAKTATNRTCKKSYRHTSTRWSWLDYFAKNNKKKMKNTKNEIIQ